MDVLNADQVQVFSSPLNQASKLRQSHIFIGLLLLIFIYIFLNNTVNILVAIIPGKHCVSIATTLLVTTAFTIYYIRPSII